LSRPRSRPPRGRRGPARYPSAAPGDSAALARPTSATDPGTDAAPGIRPNSVFALCLQDKGKVRSAECGPPRTPYDPPSALRTSLSALCTSHFALRTSHFALRTTGKGRAADSDRPPPGVLDRPRPRAGPSSGQVDVRPTRSGAAGAGRGAHRVDLGVGRDRAV